MDVVLVGFIAGFVYGGFRSGFIKRLIGIGFAIIAFGLGAWFRYPVGAIASTFFKDIPLDYANLVGYAIAFPAILAGLHLASRLVLGKLQVQGMTKEVDAGLGAVFGGIEAILILSAAVVVLDTYFGTGATPSGLTHAGMLKDLTASFNASTTVQLLRGSTVPIVLAVLGPILPTDVKTILPAGLPIPSGLPVKGLPVP
jgi:uncharacterized membrane protein required for colicin V production